MKFRREVGGWIWMRFYSLAILLFFGATACGYIPGTSDYAIRRAKADVARALGPSPVKYRNVRVIKQSVCGEAQASVSSSTFVTFIWTGKEVIFDKLPADAGISDDYAKYCFAALIIDPAAPPVPKSFKN